MLNNKKAFVNSYVSILIAIIIVLGLGYYIFVIKQNSKSQESISLKTYQDSDISFQYPTVLSLEKGSENIRIFHSIPHKHPDPCDFKGTGTEKQLENITDFDIKIKVINKNLENYLKSSDWPGYDYVIKNPYSFGSLGGYHITPGVEGCGEHIYYFKINKDKTLVINRPFISEFDPINAFNSEYKDIPGIISGENNNKYFEGILSSLSFK